MRQTANRSGQAEQRQRRAKNAAANCLIRCLDLPNVYFEAAWPAEGNRVDVLLVDRAGSGDVHVIEVAEPGPSGFKSAVARVMQVPAQFRWVAAFKTFAPFFTAGSSAPEYLYASNEMGRVGVIHIVKTAGDELGASIRFAAERFRGNYNELADRFAALNRPDVEFR